MVCEATTTADPAAFCSRSPLMGESLLSKAFSYFQEFITCLKSTSINEKNNFLTELIRSGERGKQWASFYWWIQHARPMGFTQPNIQKRRYCIAGFATLKLSSCQALSNNLWRLKASCPFGCKFGMGCQTRWNQQEILKALIKNGMGQTVNILPVSAHYVIVFKLIFDYYSYYFYYFM